VLVQQVIRAFRQSDPFTVDMYEPIFSDRQFDAGAEPRDVVRGEDRLYHLHNVESSDSER